MGTTGYAGCRVEFSDYNPAGRWYFNDFKKSLIQNNLTYEKLTTTRASILWLPRQNCHVYLGGGNNFWGFTQSAIAKMTEAAEGNGSRCYLVMRAYKKSENKDHYWLVSVPPSADVSGDRVLFSEPSDGKLIGLPQGWSAPVRTETIGQLLASLQGGLFYGTI